MGIDRPCMGGRGDPILIPFQNLFLTVLTLLSFGFLAGTVGQDGKACKGTCLASPPSQDADSGANGPATAFVASGAAAASHSGGGWVVSPAPPLAKHA